MRIKNKVAFKIANMVTICGGLIKDGNNDVVWNHVGKNITIGSFNSECYYGHSIESDHGIQNFVQVFYHELDIITYGIKTDGTIICYLYNDHDGRNKVGSEIINIALKALNLPYRVAAKGNTMQLMVYSDGVYYNVDNFESEYVIIGQPQ